MVLIDSDEKLVELASRARNSDILCIDTEFMRENSYYPQLCLMQFQTRDETFILDPFKVDDLDPLKSVMLDKNVVKVFHAAAQDLEIIYNELACMPTPIFDTQIASGLTNELNQPGLSTLLKAAIDVRISKSEGFTDWARRPLTQSQRKYAAEDVIYLPELYDFQTNKMKARGQEGWLDDEFLELEDKTRFEVCPRERFKHLKHATKLRPRQLCLAREVAAWREEAAQVQDVPRRWVLNDEQVIEICKKNPKTIDELYSIRGVSKCLDVASAREVLGALKRGNKCDKNDWPVIDEGGKCEICVDEIVPLLSALVAKRAKENEISASLIASTHDLVDLARGYKQESPLLKGWRRIVVGEELCELLDGKVELTCEGVSLKVTSKT